VPDGVHQAGATWEARPAVGIATVAYTCSSIVASAPVGWLIRNIGPHHAYMALGSTQASLLMAAALFFPSDGPPPPLTQSSGHDQEQDAKEQKTGSPYQFVAAYVAFCIGAAAQPAVLVNVQPIMETALPAGSALKLFAVPMGLTANCLGRLTWGLLTDRFPATSVQVVSTVTASFGLLVWALTYGTQWGGILAICLAGFAVPAYLSVMPMICGRVFGSSAVLYAVLFTAEGIGSISLPGITAFAQGVGWHAGLFWLSLLPISGALLVLTLPTR